MPSLRPWARERPCFTVNEAQRATGMRRPSLREKLSRLARRGDLTRIERGTYTVHDDPMIYATYVEIPSYLSLWSGLRFYDLTTQQPTTLQVIAAANRDGLPEISFYAATDLFGFGRERYGKFDIFVAEPERLILDCLARTHVPVSHLDELVETIDIDRAVTYATRLGRQSVTKRLGYLLETVRGETVEALRPDDRNYPVLDLTRPASGPTDAGWRLRVNTNVG